MNRFFIWAHRGASAVAPENTLAAFAAAHEADADGLELDVHLTRDQVPVVMHDETVDRTTDGTGRIRDLTLAQVQALDAGSWFGSAWQGERVPTLPAVIQQFAGQVRLNVEVKAVEAGEAAANLLFACENVDFVVSAFDRRLLRRLRDQYPRLPLAVLLDQGDWHRALELARQLDAVAFHPRLDLVSRPMLNCCRQLNLPVFPWTLDEPRRARLLQRQGVAGIFTNDPARLVAAFRK